MPLNITFYEAAVWIEDGFVYFNQENHKESQSAPQQMATQILMVGASSVDKVGLKWNGYATKIKTKSIDFAKFISKLPEDAYIICKMDIEGSEFPVLRTPNRNKYYI